MYDGEGRGQTGSQTRMDLSREHVARVESENAQMARTSCSWPCSSQRSFQVSAISLEERFFGVPSRNSRRELAGGLSRSVQLFRLCRPVTWHQLNPSWFRRRFI